MIRVLPACNGDAIIIRFGEKELKTILIDGGRGLASYKELKKIIQYIDANSQAIELVIITHVDDDHIDGILKIMADDTINKMVIKDVWINSSKIISEHFEQRKNDEINEIPINLNDDTKMSFKQGNSLEKYLESLGIWTKKVIKSLDSYNVSGANIKILSPNNNALKKLNERWEVEAPRNVKMGASGSDYNISIEDLLTYEFKEDISRPNGSSIAFIFEYGNISLLMLGDAHPSIIVESLKLYGYTIYNKLKLDYVKLSHHGSKANTNEELLGLIDCKNFIISTNGSPHGLPNKECLARILKCCGTDITFYFNYNISNEIFTKDEMESFGFKCIYMNESIIIMEE